MTELDLMDWIQSAATVVIPVVAWVGKMYMDGVIGKVSDVMKVETDAIRDLIEDQNIVISGISESMIENRAEDKSRDKDIRRMEEDIKDLKRKVFDK